jgi:hypothetical protein
MGSIPLDEPEIVLEAELEKDNSRRSTFTFSLVVIGCRMKGHSVQFTDIFNFPWKEPRACSLSNGVMPQLPPLHNITIMNVRIGLTAGLSTTFCH